MSEKHSAPSPTSGTPGDPETGATSAIEFLRKQSPSGPWTLTAIDPEKKDPTQTRSFAASQEDVALAWVENHQGARNLYFTINPLRAPVNRKPTKQDVAALAWLHVDLDDKDFQEGHAEAWRRINTLPPELAPTIIIESGGGLQAFWRLREPVLINGSCERLEAYSKALGDFLGGDHTQNIDRIMRLPGTINLPTPQKRALGRVPVLARLHSFDDRVFDLNQFDRFLGDGATPEHPVLIDWETLPEVDIDELRVSNKIKQLIRAQTQPTKYKSRSEVLFAVALALCGAGYDDSTIAAVLLASPLIAEHVREQKNLQQYVERQIAKARSKPNHLPLIERINKGYAMVLIGGSAVILKEPTTEKDDLKFLRVEAFSEWFANEFVRVGDKDICVAQFWRKHPKRRQYEGLTFSPERDTPGYYNLWRGFAVKPIAGDCSKFLAHLRNNVCQGSESLFKWVVGWFANVFQHPGQKCGTSLALRGKQGTGKTIIGKVFHELLGYHYLLVADPHFITGRFNAHLKSLLLLHADEGFWAGDKAAEGKLKDLVTGDWHLIEPKFSDVARVENHLRLFVTSNADWVVPAGLEERRFAVLNMGEDRMQDGTYFAAIEAEMNSGGYEALLHYLLNFDLSTVNLRQIPHTDALIEQKVNSLSPEQGWWLDILRRGVLPGDYLGCGEAFCRIIFSNYEQHARAHGAYRPSIQTKLGMLLNKMVKGLERLRITNKCGEREYIYKFPSLTDCRAQFDKMLQQQIAWDDPEADWEPDPRPPSLPGGPEAEAAAKNEKLF